MALKKTSNYILIAIMFLQILLLLYIPQVNSSYTYKLKILIDESHDQYFSYTNGNFKYAIDYLNQTGNYIINLNKNGTQLNSSILEKYEILVIPNPGNDTTFTAFEVESLINWTRNGGCLLIMSDYYHQDDNRKRGQITLLNNLLNNLSIPIEYLTADIIDDEQSETYNGQPSLIKVNYQQFSNNILGSKITNAIIRTSCINITTPGFVFTGASGPPSSYYYFSSTNKLYSPPYWLISAKIGNSIIITCGSTEVFSDEIYPSIGIKWYAVGDNLRLWVNIFDTFAMKENVIVWHYYLIILVALIIGILSLFVYNRSIKLKDRSSKQISFDDLIIERSNILKLARNSFIANNLRNATRYYRRALKISEKLKDDNGIRKYSEKLNECLKKR
ncbi:MAG: hypothetical protein ACTSPY_02790 [Candidatus Helarchaeota archaeon]